jgi:hypothetical protein
MTKFYHNFKQYYRLNSVFLHNSSLIFSTALLLVLLSVISCEEKPTIIGSGLLPGSDFVNIKSDTSLHAEAFTLLSDSIITNSRTYSYLGRLTDPYFGDSRTDFVGQLRLLKRWSGTELPAIDSVKLYLAIAGAKGILDTVTVHQIKIFEITETLNSTDKYYSNRDPRAGTELATVSLPVISKDTSNFFTINLPLSFGVRLMDDTSKLSQDKDGNPFKSYFKGLYITMVDSPSPLLLAMSFSTSPSVAVSVYYHDSNFVSSGFDFVINTNSVRYNRYVHDYLTATSPSRVLLQHINNKTKDSMIYLQAFNGVYPQIRFQGIGPIKNLLWDSVKNVARGSVNKARLTFSAFLDENTYTSTTLPPQILMKYIKSDTAQYIVPDYQVSPNFFDGIFNSTTRTYSFNLASFLQEYIKGKISDPVVDMYYPEGEYRNVILKANNSRSPVKIEFTYTKF